MINQKTVVFSHKPESGYTSIDLSGVVADSQAAGWIGSYATSVTAFASNPKYLSAVSKTRSFFTKDENMVFMTSETKSDNRLYLENSVSVSSTRNGNDIVRFINYYSDDLKELNMEPNDQTAFLDAMLLGMLSDKTTVYCIADKEETIEGVFKAFFDMPPGLVCRSSCIEVIGSIPEVKASVMMCKCVDGGDYEFFLNKIKSKTDYIIIDFMGAKPVITVNINNTSYAQRVLYHIIRAYNPTFRTVAVAFHCPIGNIERFKLYDYGVDKNTFFNTVAHYVLAYKYPQDKYNVYATQDEKEKIENFVVSRGIEK